MSTNPTPATGPEAAARIHFTDPRIAALSKAAHAASIGGGRRPWPELSWDEQHAWRTGARDWLRAAVTVGLLPLVVPSTGEALAAVPLDVRPGDGRPRAGSRGRAQTFRDAAHAVRPDAFGWGGPDHHDAWTEAEQRLLQLAKEEEASVGGVQDATQPTTDETEARRRLAAVERLCSGRPGYHQITVKELLTAMSVAAGAQS